MQTQKQTLGQLGEKLAEKYLTKKGHQIIDRNYRQKWGEIDLIAKKEKKYFFVEVKTLAVDFDQEENSLLPEDHLTKSKIKKLCRIILGYVNHYKIENWQLDLIAIEIDKTKKKYRLRHLKQIA